MNIEEVQKVLEGANLNPKEFKEGMVYVIFYNPTSIDRNSVNAMADFLKTKHNISTLWCSTRDSAPQIFKVKE